MKPNEMAYEQLTEAVAREVMGWEIAKPPLDENQTYTGPSGTYFFSAKFSTVIRFKPLIDANHWMMVVEKMREKGWDFMLEWRQGAKWFPLFFHYPDWNIQYCARNVIIGRAICEAALEAVRGGKDDNNR